MADKKISALDPATTPLAGTEVVPIVQSGSTKKVSVDNLTAGKAVSALSLTATNLKTSPAAANLDISGVTVAAGGTDTNISPDIVSKGTGSVVARGIDRATSTYGNFHVQSDSNAAVYNGGSLSFGGKSVATGAQYIFGGLKFMTDPTTVTGWDTFGTLSLTNADSSVSEKISWFNNGNLNLNTGNLVIGTSGKGIDFSADPSAAGMTSELLDDYEEGTWTPSQGSGLTVIGAFSSSGTYTKVGRQVTVLFTIAGATSIAVTAGAQITGNLPFTAVAAMDSAGTIYRFGAAGGECIAGGSQVNVFSGAAISAGGGLNISTTYFV
jgi:hypothetical protein